MASQGQAPLLGMNLSQGSAPMSGLNSTVRPPSILRQEAHIYQGDLAKNVHTDNGRIKSQRGGLVDIFVFYRVKWPHKYVLSGQNKDRIYQFTIQPIVSCSMDEWLLQDNA